MKSELVVAREEIARMKSAGLGESVQTNQAVAQLQEALGTIRILQESSGGCGKSEPRGR